MRQCNRAVSATVTVTGEEHYQDAILASKPEPWDRPYWPALVGLDIESDPHSKRGEPRIGVLMGGSPVGFLTAAMTKRYAPTVDAALRRGDRVTATGLVKMGSKGNARFWRLKLSLVDPHET